MNIINMGNSRYTGWMALFNLGNEQKIDFYTHHNLGNGYKIDFSIPTNLGSQQKIDFPINPNLGNGQKIDFLASTNLGNGQKIDFMPAFSPVINTLDLFTSHEIKSYILPQSHKVHKVLISFVFLVPLWDIIHNHLFRSHYIPLTINT